MAKAREMAVSDGAVAGAQSIRRALSVLRALAEGQDAGVGLSDVARAPGVSRPTVHRIVRGLMEEGLVEQNARNRRYAIGEQVSILALARRARSPLLLAAQPHLDRLAKMIGDTKVKALNGARLTLPPAERDDTQAIGRGTTIPVRSR